jgi:membrane protease YdiL (CAAX protease family)
VAGAIGTELLPQRRLVDRQVAGVMVGIAVVNAVGEELLWRGVFLDRFTDDVVRGALWPLAGFTVWHLAPQLILPSPRGLVGFLLGAAVGAVSCPGGRA